MTKKNKTLEVVVPYYTFLEYDSFADAVWASTKGLGWWPRIIALGLAHRIQKSNQIKSNEMYIMKLRGIYNIFGRVNYSVTTINF